MCFLLQCSFSPHNETIQVISVKKSLPVLRVHFMQAPVGDIRPPVAWKELAAAGGAPFVAEDPSAAYTDASTVQVWT